MWTPRIESPGNILRTAWRRMSPLPGGRWLFSQMVGLAAPYTGTMGANVIELQPGHCVVCMDDRRGVRNHLRSVHAAALANMLELTTGLAVSASLPSDMRGILTQLDVRYLKKARGPLQAEAHCEVVSVSERATVQAQGEIRSQAGEIVATATAHWLVGPRRAG